MESREVVAKAKEKKRGKDRPHGDCICWTSKDQCSRGDSCSFNHVCKQGQKSDKRKIPFYFRNEKTIERRRQKRYQRERAQRYQSVRKVMHAEGADILRRILVFLRMNPHQPQNVKLPIANRSLYRLRYLELISEAPSVDSFGRPSPVWLQPFTEGLVDGACGSSSSAGETIPQHTSSTYSSETLEQIWRRTSGFNISAQKALKGMFLLGMLSTREAAE